MVSCPFHSREPHTHSPIVWTSWTQQEENHLEEREKEEEEKRENEEEEIFGVMSSISAFPQFEKVFPILEATEYNVIT